MQRRFGRELGRGACDCDICAGLSQSDRDTTVRIAAAADNDSHLALEIVHEPRLSYYCLMTLLGWALMAVGLMVYLAAFAKGAGPTMGDDTLQASLFTIATVMLIGGFVLVAVI